MIKAARIKFEKLLGETPRAFLIRLHNGQHWIPKSQCRSFITNKKLGGNVILPAWLINKIYDTDINKSDKYEHLITPTWVITHHKPERKEPLESNIIQRLKK